MSNRNTRNGDTTMTENRLLNGTQNGDVEGNITRVETPSKFCGPGCPSRLAHGTAYFIATVFFLVGLNAETLPSLPFPLIGNLLPWSARFLWPQCVTIPLIMWGLHALRRFAEILFLHDYRRSVPLLKGFFMNLYGGFFGMWIGWSLNFSLQYITPHIAIVVVGFIIFAVGQIGNCIAHVKLRQLRNGKFAVERELSTTQYVMPRGFLFKYISCPHYLFEVVSWLGFAIATFTLATFIFVSVVLIVTCVKAYRRHKRYQNIFNGHDPRPLYTTPKAIIPFVF